MSYDIVILDKDTKREKILAEPHSLHGGTRVSAATTTRAWFNITYNYAEVYSTIADDFSIKNLDGNYVQDARRLVEKALEKIPSARPYEQDYWAPTLGNARKALEDLLALLAMCEEGDHVEVH